MTRCPICSSRMLTTSLGQACSRPTCTGPTTAPLVLRAVVPKDAPARPSIPGLSEAA